MTTKTLIYSAACALSLAGTSYAGGPYPPTDWPTTIDPNKKVHFMVVDGVFAAPNANWNQCLSICALNAGAGSDQNTVLTPCLAGFTGQKGTSTYFNIADSAYYEWATNGQIDVLMQVYGDTAVLNPTNYNMGRRVRFQEGTTGTGTAVGSSTQPSPAQQLYSSNAYNLRWNWILFSITNAWYTNSGVGYRLVGNPKPGATGNFSNGGINGGTLRMQCADNQGGAIAGMMGFTVHAIALGEAGAFGTTNDINQFEPVNPDATNCPPAPAANLVEIDFNAGRTNYLQLMSDDPNFPDQMAMATNAVGPAGDQRNAIVPTAFNGNNGYLINFGVLSNYLGVACNPNEVWKIAVDFYDDPAFAGMGVQFGPEAYATDSQGCAAPSVYPATGLQVLQGTGQWIRRSWTVGGNTGVNLVGVNVAPLTGGPRLICVNQPVAVSRVQMGILRTTGPLAGIDPLADVPQDPLVCQGAYTNYIELDLANGITNGLDVGTSSGDQNMVVEMAGPTSDQRLSVRASFGDTGSGIYLQFQILTNALGPSYQDNAHIAVVATYYDDPALVGKHFGIDAWRFQLLAQNTIYATDSSKWITLQGTGKWLDAYWEIDRIQFTGVNQSPQAAARFKCDDRIHVSRVRYAVIRNCGPYAGQNQLDSYRVTNLSAAADTNALLRLSWPYREPQLTLQAVPAIGGTWTTFMGTPIPAEGEQAVVRLSPTNSSQFFRLFRPAIP